MIWTTISIRILNNRSCLLRTVHSSYPGLNKNRWCGSIVQSSENERSDKLWYYNKKEGYVRLSPYDKFTIPDETLDKYIWKDFHQWQNKTAAVCIKTGRSYTFAQLRDHCAALAVNIQQKLKLQFTNIIAVCLPNIPEYAIITFGAIEAGLAVTTINPLYTAHEIGRQLENSNANCLVGTVDNYQILKNACDIAKKKIPIICIKTERSDVIPRDSIDFFDLIDPKGVNFSNLKSGDITKKDLAFLPYSSGTTGLPKGVYLTHGNITSNCEMIKTHSPFPHYIQPTTDTHQDVVPCLLPFFHIYGLVVCMISMLKLGCKLITIPKFVPEDFINSIVEYKATMLYVVPPLVLFLTNSEKITRDQADRLRIAMSGAAPMGLLDAERFLNKFPHVNFVQGYGLTETSPVCLMSPSGLKKYASAGYVVSNTKAKIVAFDTEQPVGVGPNQKGELCFQGPQVMKGYFNNEEATKRSFYPDRWFRTGDIGYYDEDGAFYVTDRLKELIKVKGFQVPPAELEELLRDHPKIDDAAVIGIPDHTCGELPHAFVVLKKGTSATEVEIKEFIANKVIEYKRLEGGITFINEIPKTASGKILRKDLRLRFE